MSSYISSNANRWYCALENSYGQVPAIGAANRIPAVKLTARQQLEKANRKDKTGSRTFPGNPPGERRQTTFDLITYMSTWAEGTASPGYGPLFQAGLGAEPLEFRGGLASGGATPSSINFAAAHGLSNNQAVTFNGEIRFVVSVVSPVAVIVNAPFSTAPGSGATFGSAVTYLPTLELPSVSIFDYWTPSTAVQRVLCGAAIDKVLIHVNADFHEFQFTGMAQDLIDSASFTSGNGQLTSFPAEPAPSSFDYSIIPGHLGQAWLGSSPTQFLTITEASIELSNNLDLRAREFGSVLPKSISPGQRAVSMDFAFFEMDDIATQELYQAARQQSPISVMWQLGQANGQLFGVFMKSVIPEVPEFDDKEHRLQWRFRHSRAQGTVDDEIAVAFG